MLDGSSSQDHNQPTGKELSYTRPAVIISDSDYNEKSDTIIVVPMTNTNRKAPFEIPVVPGMKTTGVARVDQIKAVDRERFLKKNHRIVVVEKAPEEFLDKIGQVLMALTGFNA